MSKPQRKTKKSKKAPIRELGEKHRAGRAFTEYLRGIGTEATELITDPETGKTKIVSKAEALARKVWEKALGLQWDEDLGRYIQDDIKLVWVKLLLERTEGRPGTQSDTPADKAPSIADRVSETNRDRINAIAEGQNDDESDFPV